MDISIKRGIDLQNRLWETTIGKKLKKTFSVWEGGPADKLTILGIAVVSLINLFFIIPLFSKNLAGAFSNSSFILFVAHLFGQINSSAANYFFLSITFLSFIFAPISVYLFVRRIAYRHELTAFFAALFFVLPNSITSGGSQFLSLLSGDGTHAVAFSFIPLFLLYFKAFLQTGTFAYGFLSSLQIALIALLSPFGLFNFIIFMVIITIGEGLVEKLRLKIGRLMFVLTISFLLSYFWYNPQMLTQIFIHERVKLAASFAWRFFPLLIPVIPILGTVFFLIFDKRKRLQPIFIGSSLFIVYFLLKIISSSYNLSGIFTEGRYNIEFSFTKSLIFALIFGFSFNFIYAKIKTAIGSKVYLMLLVLASLATGIIIALYSITKDTFTLYKAIQEQSIITHNSFGIGNVEKTGMLGSISSILSIAVSVITFIFLCLLLRYYPPQIKDQYSSSSSNNPI